MAFQQILRGVRRLATTLLVSAALAMPGVAWADKVEENPSGGKMMIDLLIARPIGVGVLGLGTLTYLVTLPFSLAGGNAREAGSNLVVEPAREAFVRCLGCSKTGRKERVRQN